MCGTVENIWDALNKLRDEGLISIRRHPVYPISVIKYTAEAMYDGWLKGPESHNYPYTLLPYLRGIVIDDKGKIVSGCLKKFFNVEELPENEADYIMAHANAITEKFDGTCMLLSEYDGEKFFRTLGSFDSGQALNSNKLFLTTVSNLNTRKYTYMFEYISPEDRKVVNYGNETRLVFICRIDNETGRDEFFEEINDDDIFSLMDFKHVIIQHLDKNISALKGLDIDNAEGFVIRAENGARMKIKFENYLEKFRSKFQYTINDARMDWLENAGGDYDKLAAEYKWDEEMATYVKGLFARWDDQYEATRKVIYDIYAQYKDLPTIKDFAMAVNENPYRAALIMLYKNKNRDCMGWIKKFVIKSK